MKTLQHEAQPAKAKAKPEATKAAPALAEGFTARELDAAEQLIQLSESSASSGTPRGARRAPSAASGSSSPRSVNAPSAPGAPPLLRPVGPGPAGYEAEEEHEVAGSQRRTKRYRLTAEIYDATEEIGGCNGHKNKKE